ncbi:MFS transporter [Cellulomonas iranensis]|uniref:MFS family arabinose efflux permease n=1 Tax=Cellulomonas iranensis TaxID=76862 RepID=A0ABU0GIW3_9CELL|nr:MFS transporter [Cellulomonas iranensis]MDQ0424641.1 putative MFS family arabinose efflux permease [Cellulomonas iranensis]
MRGTTDDVVLIEEPGVVRRFIAARSVAILGDQTVTYFVPIAVYGATRSVTTSGVAFLVQWLPRIVSTPLSGAVVDRFPPRAQLVVVDLLRAALLGGAALTGSISALVVASGLATLLNGHSTIAVESILGRQVPPDAYPRTQSDFQAAQQLVTVAGPALGGALVAALPTDAGLAVIAAVFVLSGAWTGAGFRALGRGTVGAGESSVAARLRTGVRTVLTSRATLALVGVTLCVNLVGSLALASLPPIVAGSLGEPDAAVGVLAAAATVLSLGAAVIVGRVTAARPVDVVLPWVLGALAISAVLMVVAHHVVVMGIGYGLWSAGVTAFAVWMRTWRVRLIPREHLGAGLGVFVSLIMVTAPLAGLVLATVGERIGPQATLAAAALASALAVVPAYRRFRRETALHPDVTG